MWKILSALKKNLVWSVPAFMIAGIVFGALTNAGFLKATIIPLTFLMVYPMMINLQIAKVFAGGDFNPHSAAPQMKYERNRPKPLFYLEEKD